MLGVNPPPPLQLHASQAVHQSPQQGAPPQHFLYRKMSFQKIHPPRFIELKKKTWAWK